MRYPLLPVVVVLSGVMSTVGGGCGSAPDGMSGSTRTVTVQPEPGTGGKGRASRKPREKSRPNVPGGNRCRGAHEGIDQQNLRRAEIAIRCLTNAARRKQGLDELAFDERLARAAANRSKAMADANFFGHRGPGNSNVRRAVDQAGWVPPRESWLVGENIGWAGRGKATAAVLVRSWLDSPNHRRNMLSRDFTHLGVGAVAAVPRKRAKAGATVTQIFGVTGRRARAAQSR